MKLCSRCKIYKADVEHKGGKRNYCGLCVVAVGNLNALRARLADRRKEGHVCQDCGKPVANIRSKRCVNCARSFWGPKLPAPTPNWNLEKKEYET